MAQALGESERNKKALRREVELVGREGRGRQCSRHHALDVLRPFLACAGPSCFLPHPEALCHPYPVTPSTPPCLQLLSDLRKRQREVADIGELAAAKEERLRGEIAELGEVGRFAGLTRRRRLGRAAGRGLQQAGRRMLAAPAWGRARLLPCCAGAGLALGAAAGAGGEAGGGDGVHRQVPAHGGGDWKAD